MFMVALVVELVMFMVALSANLDTLVAHVMYMAAGMELMAHAMSMAARITAHAMSMAAHKVILRD